MTYNPQKHHRRSIRLKGYDYSQAGLYFITICCQNRICRFGHIENGKMFLNDLGLVAYNEWAKLPERFPNFELDVFQIMPNHIHGIIVLNELPVGAGFTPVQNRTITPAQYEKENMAPARFPPRVSDIVGAYKSLVSNECLKLFKRNNDMMGKLWQRNYHEHIIRNEQSYMNISNYIINNPANWNSDSLK
ncbi:transposase [Natronoflexus pectinivorans]|uniref:REP element-mobilizing transposase RayT n=1 Tax=Natronoflexus pectinivorans TaxID=682526 RepID=A0A4R2GL13_9BACT|nr:transposase [Natronoflexus pectinivorans]TCO09257.1 REP element-mobilizing transposase RayT [Natronoflexus pectinivorans]